MKQLPPDRPKASSLRPLRRALPFLRPYVVRLFLAFLCLCAASVAALCMPISIRYVIDEGFSGAHTHAIDYYFLALLGLAALYSLFGSCRYYLVMWIGERVVADIRAAVYKHVIKMSPTFFEVTRTGEVLSRLTTDTTLVQTVVGSGMSMALRSAFILLGAMVMLFVTSPRLTLYIILLVPLAVLPIILYGRKIRKLSRASQDRVADSSSIAAESLNAIQIIQAFTLEDFQGRRFGDSVEVSFAAARRRLQVSAWLLGTIILTAFGAIVVVIWLGAYAVADGSMSLGALAQFLLYATFVAATTTALGEVWSDIQRAAGAMERLMELLGAQTDIKPPKQPQALPTRVSGRMAIKDLYFHYPSRPGECALNDFSLAIRPGETLALVGPSGAGKSTVFQLLLRFYDPQQGTIEIEGVRLVDADPLAVRKCIGIVPQHTVLFADSALENIRLGRPEADDAAVMAAARSAIADEFIEKLPQGYHSFLGEKGVRLSGGQQQRIAIARAILKNPPILLLDEATSALDAESELLVQEALEHLMQNRTTIVIAHRLATVISADRIIVMDQGRIVDVGSHAELIAKNGLYARLAELQFDKSLKKTSSTAVDRSHARTEHVDALTESFTDI